MGKTKCEAIPYKNLDHRQEILDSFTKEQLQYLHDLGNCFYIDYNIKVGCLI